MTPEKKRFSVVGGHATVAGQKPDENGHVLLTEREALYERSIGRLVPVDLPSPKRGRGTKRVEPVSPEAGDPPAPQDLD